MAVGSEPSARRWILGRQLTIRYDDDLGERIDKVAAAEGISRNRAVVRLLRKGAGLTAPTPAEDVIGDSLDWFIGSWSDQEARELEAAVEDFETIDAELWK